MTKIQTHLSRTRTGGPAPLFVATLCGAMLTLPALASDITVGSPLSGTQVSSPVLIRAHNIGCDGVPPTSFGYSIDSTTGLVLGATPYDIDVTAQAIPAGTHTVHFKSWTSRGECPTVNTTFKVSGAIANQASTGIPSFAISSGDLDGSGGWTEQHDGGTPGTSRGSTVYPASTPLYDDARKFYMTYTDEAGERWSNTFTRDPNAVYFVLDTYIYLPNPSEVKNIEMDINQVIADGETIILSTQCSGEIGVWESGYTEGAHDHWKSSKIKCNPKDWAANVWHHVQIGEHREANGIVSHDWVNLDGTHYVWGEVQLSAHFLDWGAGDLNTQFQIEGASSGSGTATAYIHKFTIYRWQPDGP
jgi:hypothetical protein